MLFKNTITLQSVASLTIAPGSIVHAELAAAAAQVRIGSFAAVDPTLEALASDIVNWSKSASAFSVKMFTRDGISVKMDHPFTPSTVIGLTTILSSKQENITVWRRSGKSEVKALQVVTDGVLSQTPLTSRLTALVLRGLAQYVQTLPGLTAFQRATMARYESEAEIQLSLMAGIPLEVAALPEETVIATGGSLWIQRPVPPEPLGDYIQPVTVALVPGIVKYYFDKLLTDAKALTAVNTIYAQLGSLPGYEDPFIAFYAAQGFGGWSDPDQPWARIACAEAITYNPTDMTEALLNGQAGALVGLYSLYARWFRAGQSLGKADHDKAFMNFTALIQKLAPDAVIDVDDLPETLEEYIIRLLPGVDWTDAGILSGVMAGLEFRRGRLYYGVPIVPQGLERTNLLFLRVLTSYLHLHHSVWPTVLTSQISNVDEASGAVTVAFPVGSDGSVVLDVLGPSPYKAYLYKLEGSSAAQAATVTAMTHLYELEEIMWTLMGATSTKDTIVGEDGSVTVKGARSRLTSILGATWHSAASELVLPYE